MPIRNPDNSALLDEQNDTGREFRLPRVERSAEVLLQYVRQVKGVNRAVIAGSYRRRRETISRLEILAVCEDDSPVVDRLVELDEVGEIVTQNETCAAVRLRGGLRVSLHVVPEAAFGAALHRFTGSESHIQAVREMGAARDLDVTELGVFRGEDRIAGRTEEEVYEAVGLPCIPPELRENRGEIEAAQDGVLPKLITLDDIRGDLHSHTTATDGRSTLEEMAAAARARGYEYLAVTDHSTYAMGDGGMNETRLRRQMERIDRMNEEFDGFRVLKGLEVDIRKDGALDMSDAVLAELDIVVCSLHAHFDLPERMQTERVVRAMDNPYFNVYAHPTARLSGYHDAIEIDLERVMEAALERGCFLELNSKPNRLDLNDVWCKRAKEMGLKVAISTDSHEAERFQTIRFGIGQARRGWLEAEDVLNTRRWAELKQLLRRG